MVRRRPYSQNKAPAGYVAAPLYDNASTREHNLRS